MFRGINLLGLLDWPMIQPKDDVPVIVEFRTCNRDWLIGVMGKNGERASGIEADTADCCGIDVVLCQSLLDRRADTSPYVVC